MKTRKKAAPPRDPAVISAERVLKLWNTPGNYVFAPLKDSPAAQEILSRFLLPLKFVPMPPAEEVTLTEKLQLAFDPKYREVLFYKCTKPFKMLGNLVEQYGIDKPIRELVLGDLCIVRFDSRDPRYMEIQVFRKFNQESESSWYNIKHYQWRHIRKHLQQISED